MLHAFLVNPDQQPADDTPRTWTWTAPRPVQIRRLWTWIGATCISPEAPFPYLDAYTTIYSSHEEGFIALFYPLDIYANYAGDRGRDALFEPGQIVLPVGGIIAMGHRAKPLDPAVHAHSHPILLGHYEDVS